MTTPYDNNASFLNGSKNIFLEKINPFNTKEGIYTNCISCDNSYLLFNNSGFLLLDNGGKIII